MPSPFSVVNQTNESTVFTIDGSGNTTQSGNATITGTLTSGAFTPSSSSTTGNATVGGNLAVTGNTTLSGTLTTTGNTQLNGTTGSAGLLTASAGVNLTGIATPGTPTTSAVVYANSAFQPAAVTPSGQVLTIGGVSQAQTSTVTVASTASITALTSYTVPANDVSAGAVYTVHGYGVYSWTGTPTIVFTLLWGGTGGTALATLPTLTLGTAQTNAVFNYTGTITCRSTTSVVGELEINLSSASASGLIASYMAAPTAATTITSNTSNALVVAVTWGTSSSSNTISLLGGYVERIA